MSAKQRPGRGAPSATLALVPSTPPVDYAPQPLTEAVADLLQALNANQLAHVRSVCSGRFRDPRCGQPVTAKHLAGILTEIATEIGWP